jgi:hypothetical protein
MRTPARLGEVRVKPGGGSVLDHIGEIICSILAAVMRDVTVVTELVVVVR